MIRSLSFVQGTKEVTNRVVTRSREVTSSRLIREEQQEATAATNLIHCGSK